jgi:hypothetical protein
MILSRKLRTRPVRTGDRIHGASHRRPRSPIGRAPLALGIEVWEVRRAVSQLPADEREIVRLQSISKA